MLLIVSFSFKDFALQLFPQLFDHFRAHQQQHSATADPAHGHGHSHSRAHHSTTAGSAHTAHTQGHAHAHHSAAGDPAHTAHAQGHAHAHQHHGHSHNEEQRFAILVSTSGDTGSATVDGFCTQTNIPVVVLFPADGVSPVQRAQMVTARSARLHVLAVRDADFDFCQSALKTLFNDAEFTKLLADRFALRTSGNVCAL